MDPDTLAQKVCTAQELMNPGRNLVPGGTPAWLRSTSQTWISSDQLKTILENIKGLPAGLTDKAVELFPRFEHSAARRFSFFMRVNSMVWALVVAVLFQISAPDLLRTLSADPNLRASYAESFEDVATYPDVALQAFERLKGVYEEVEPIAWEPPANASREQILRSLRAAIGGLEKPETLVAAYADSLDELYLDQVKTSVTRLAKLDIQPWGKGHEYYWVVEGEDLKVFWKNILGVLMTAILLTLGAPFWFKALKNLSGLKDLLSPTTKGADGAGQQSGQSGP